MAACAWFGNIGYCSASERYSGLFELPMWMYQTASETPAASDLMDPANAYTVLKREFDRNYKANKAPVGIWVHAYSTGYFDKQYVAALLTLPNLTWFMVLLNNNGPPLPSVSSVPCSLLHSFF